MAPPNVAAVIAALEIIQSEPERMRGLRRDNTHRMAAGLQSIGFSVGDAIVPILPVHVGDNLECFKVCRLLQDEGVFVNPVIAPAVESGHALTRVSLVATHTLAQIDFALEKFQKVGEALNLL